MIAWASSRSRHSFPRKMHRPLLVEVNARCVRGRCGRNRIKCEPWTPNFWTSWPARFARGPLQYRRSEQVLICRMDRLSYPIRDGVPVMLEEEARQLAPDDPLLDR